MCESDRSYAYAGPVYSVVEIEDETICPWCIADGSAAASLDAVFADVHSLAGLEGVIVGAVATRTPGYLSWQQDQWLVHCADACAFLGRFGNRELDQYPSEATEAALAAVRNYGGPTGAEHDALFLALHSDGDYTGYLFQCLACGAYKAYVDSL